MPPTGYFLPGQRDPYMAQHFPAVQNQRRGENQYYAEQVVPDVFLPDDLADQYRGLTPAQKQQILTQMQSRLRPVPGARPPAGPGITMSLARTVPAAPTPAAAPTSPQPAAPTPPANPLTSIGATTPNYLQFFSSGQAPANPARQVFDAQTIQNMRNAVNAAALGFSGTGLYSANPAGILQGQPATPAQMMAGAGNAAAMLNQGYGQATNRLQTEGQLGTNMLELLGTGNTPGRLATGAAAIQTQRERNQMEFGPQAQAAALGRSYLQGAAQSGQPLNEVLQNMQRFNLLAPNMIQRFSGQAPGQGTPGQSPAPGQQPGQSPTGQQLVSNVLQRHGTVSQGRRVLPTQEAANAALSDYVQQALNQGIPIGHVRHQIMQMATPEQAQAWFGARLHPLDNSTHAQAVRGYISAMQRAGENVGYSSFSPTGGTMQYLNPFSWAQRAGFGL